VLDPSLHQKKNKKPFHRFSLFQVLKKTMFLCFELLMIICNDVVSDVDVDVDVGDVLKGVVGDLNILIYYFSISCIDNYFKYLQTNNINHL